MENKIRISGQKLKRENPINEAENILMEEEKIMKIINNEMLKSTKLEKQLKNACDVANAKKIIIDEYEEKIKKINEEMENLKTTAGSIINCSKDSPHIQPEEIQELKSSIKVINGKLIDNSEFSKKQIKSLEQKLMLLKLKYASISKVH